MSIPPKEMESVLALSGPERYGYFIERVADREQAWGLRNEDGWVLIGFDDGDAFCLWHEADYALACAIDDWSDCVPEPISLEEIMEELLPSLVSDELRAAVFPTPEGETVVVDPRDLQEHLEAAIEHQWGAVGEEEAP